VQSECESSWTVEWPWLCSPHGVPCVRFCCRLERQESNAGHLRQEKVTPRHGQSGQSFHRYGSLFLELVHIVSCTLRVFGFFFSSFFLILGKRFFDLHKKVCIKLLHPSKLLLKLFLKKRKKKKSCFKLFETNRKTFSLILLVLVPSFPFF